MAKKQQNNEDDPFVMLIVILVGIIYFVWDFIVRNWLFLLIGVVALIVLYCYFKYKRAKRRELEYEMWWQERYHYLMNRYQDEDVVKGIMNEQFWQGQTKEMLLDSLGRPDDKDIKVLKNKRREVWKYGKINARSYRTKIILENGVVIGYDC